MPRSLRQLSRRLVPHALIEYVKSNDVRRQMIWNTYVMGTPRFSGSVKCCTFWTLVRCAAKVSSPPIGPDAAHLNGVVDGL